MFARVLGALVLAIGLPASAQAATVTYDLVLQTAGFAPITDRAKEGGTREHRLLSGLFPGFGGFNPALGHVSGITLDIHERWSVRADVINAGDGAGKNDGRVTTVANLLIGGDAFEERLTRLRTDRASCETASDTDSCTATQSRHIDTTHSFALHADQALALLSAPTDVTFDFNTRSHFSGAGRVDGYITDVEMWISLNIEYTNPAPLADTGPTPPAVPLPASGLLLIAGLGTVAALRRKQTKPKA